MSFMTLYPKREQYIYIFLDKAIFFVDVCIYSPFQFSCVVFSRVLNEFYFLSLQSQTISEGVLSSVFLFIPRFFDRFLRLFYRLFLMFCHPSLFSWYILHDYPLLSVLNVFNLFYYYIFIIFKNFIIKYEFYLTFLSTTIF